MSRIRAAAGNLRRAARYLVRVANVIVHGPPPPIVFEPVAGDAHPSLKCRCGDVLPDEHAEGCEWAKVMCRTCEGDGHCPDCRGDGISTGNGLRSALDERAAVVAFIRDLVDKERRGHGLVQSNAATGAVREYAATVLALVADNLEIGAHVGESEF